METIVDNFKKLNTPSRADLMIKLMHINTLLLIEKLGGSTNLSQLDLKSRQDFALNGNLIPPQQGEQKANEAAPNNKNA